MARSGRLRLPLADRAALLLGPDQCAGRTLYEDAIGGRGTRITFEGELAVDAGALPHIPAALDATASAGIESFVTTLVPKNFRKLTTALSVFLGQDV